VSPAKHAFLQVNPPFRATNRHLSCGTPVGAEAAFDLLRSMSQRENARLVDVAAAVVGVTLPEEDRVDLDESVLPARLRPSSATSSMWRAMRERPEVRQGAAGAVMDVLSANARDGEDAAQLLAEFLAGLEVAAVALWRVRPDASVEQVGQVGYDGDTMSAWRRIPLSVDAPITRAVRDDAPVFRSSESQLIEEFPVLAGNLSGFKALAVVPVRGDGDVMGLVGMSWRQERVFTPAQQEQVTNLAARAGRLLLRDLPSADNDWAYLVAVLGLMTDPWIVLRAVDDRPAGLVIEGAAPRLPELEASVGERLLAVYPRLATNGLVLEKLTALTRDGGRLELETSNDHPGAAPWGPGTVDLRATRVGSRLIVVWRATDG
jgi:hypothetical protein